MNNKNKGTVMQIVRVKTNLSEEEMLTIARDREPQFRAIPGIIQKYYVKLAEPGMYGGIYIWYSRESLQKFRDSELAKTIAKAYEAVEPPLVEVVDIMFRLRE
jgi:heme-degrading monooxygenase HmoA